MGVCCGLYLRAAWRVWDAGYLRRKAKWQPAADLCPAVGVGLSQPTPALTALR